MEFANITLILSLLYSPARLKPLSEGQGKIGSA
jgi:hypothetical protein